MDDTKVLLIASEVEIHQEAKTILAPQDYSVVIADNHHSALQLVTKSAPDVIICDLNSKTIDPNFLRSQLKQFQNSCLIPWIMLGGYVDRQQHRQAMDMGADDILFRPYCPLETQKVIAQCLTKSEIATSLAKNKIFSEKFPHEWQQLSQLGQNFTELFSHEMRTSLTGIISSSEFLLDRIEELETLIVKELLTCITLSGKRLSRFIHNFLLYAQLKTIASDPEKVHHLRQNVTYSAKNTIATIAQQHTKKYNRQQDLILELQDAQIKIGTYQLTKLVTELIDNACKFSTNGTNIKVASLINQDNFILTISDRGRGMTHQTIARINREIPCDPVLYEQQDSGLGLIVSQYLVRLYQGKLSIDSNLNQGTSVVVTIPLSGNQHHSADIPQQNFDSHEFFY